jgi:hypothetical protein
VTWQEPSISDGGLDEPYKKKPTCPIATKEHKNATDNKKNHIEISKGEVDRVRRYKHPKILSGLWHCEFPVTGMNSYDAGQNQYPANNSDGERAFHRASY